MKHKALRLISRTSLSIILSAACATLIPSTALADFPFFGSSSSGGSLNISCSSGTDCLIAGYGGQQLNDWLFQVPYAQAQTTIGGSVLTTILTPSSSSITSPQAGVQKAIYILLTNTNNTTGNNLLTQTAGILSSNIVAPNYQQNASNAQKIQAASNVNPDVLISPTAFTSVALDSQNAINEASSADTFIQYVTGLANSPTTIDFNTIAPPAGQTKAEFFKQLMTIPDVQNYLLQLRTFTAQQAVAISNFYHLYNERAPITDPDMQAKITAALTPPSGSSLQPPPSGELSPLQVEQYLATRRINDAKWYTSMQNASPAAVDRSILYLLAEFPPMLLQLHLDLERLLATMSVLVAQQGTTSKVFMQQAYSQANTAIQNAVNPPPEPNSTQDQINQQLRQQASQAVNQ